MSERSLVRPTTKPATSFHSYDPRFPKIARILIDAIQNESRELSAEHIGSTAVPGCPGKGIIDLMVIYRAGGDATANAALESLGFTPQGPEFKHRDSFPPGHLVRIGEMDHDGETFRVYLHAVPEDSDEIALFRNFRDLLTQNPDLLARYGALKRAVVEEGITDTDEYVVRKIAIIKEILNDDPGETFVT